MEPDAGPCTEGAVAAWVALARVDGLLSDRLDEALRDEVGLTLHEHDVLVQVVMGGGILQMGDVARSIVVSKSGATRLVARLEHEGLIERVTFPEDRRATFARLTTAGHEIMQRSQGVFGRVLGEAFAAHLSEPEMATLRAALGKVLDAHGWRPPGPCPQAWAEPLVEVAAPTPAAPARRQRARRA